MWRAGLPDPADVKRFRDVARALRSHATGDTCQLPDQSRDPRSGHTGEIDCRRFAGNWSAPAIIGAEYLVLHPGNYKGQSSGTGHCGVRARAGGSVEGLSRAGFDGVAREYRRIGRQIGRRFEELRTIRDLAARETDLPVAYCLDTCHLLASGHDVASAAGLKQTVRGSGAGAGLDW